MNIPKCAITKRPCPVLARVKQKIDRDVPDVYASIALALIRRSNMTADDVEVVFAESQSIWNESIQSGIDVPEMCMAETGIDVRRETGDE